ncbi:MAG: sulfotransferase, partial [Parvibaculaceae bacterium]
GLIHLNKGQAAAALPYLYYSLELKPRAAVAHNTLGNALRKLGRGTEAEAAYRTSVELDAKHALAWFNLASLLADAGRNDEAEKAYRSAIAARPDYAEAHLNLGNVLRAEKRYEEALAVLQKLVILAPRYAFAHNNLGNILRDLDRLEEAENAYARSIEVDPQYALAWLNLGTVRNHLGKMAPAADALRQALALAPRYGEAFMQLSGTARLMPDDRLVADMERHYADPATPRRDRMYMAFGLGSAYDRAGRYDEAFAHFTEGNRLKRASIAFDIASERRIVASIEERFSGAFLAGAQPAPTADETPIFIIGMMRSGTTLMEQILASHPDVAGADELPWMAEIAFGFVKDGLRYPDYVPSLSAAELTRLGEDYLHRLRKRFGPGPRFVTDKLPGNFLTLGLIHLALPKAKIIHMRRDPHDTCLSIYTTLFASQHHYAYDMTELGEFYRLYRRLMAHWDRVLPGKIYHQRYEDLVAEPEANIRKVLDFCGLAFDKACLDFHATERRVRTASSTQVREKLHGRSVGRWRNYERHLGAWTAMFGDTPVKTRDN